MPEKNIFKFQQFSVEQSSEVFKVGTDAVLLGALAFDIHQSPLGNMLEIGTGTGIISLMLAQRFPQWNITAIDISPKAVHLAKKNFQKAPFSDRLCAMQVDFKKMSERKIYDFICSNPPYFLLNSSNKIPIARQKIALDFDCLVQKTAKLLSSIGVFSVIVPLEAQEVLVDLCHKNTLYFSRVINIKGRLGRSTKRVILEFSRQRKALQTEEFIIEKSPRQYSDQYLEATKKFHLFK